MKKRTIMQVIQMLKACGFEDVEYCDSLGQFRFHNASDIMDNYVTITYSRHFRKFSVRIHSIETANITELAEVAKRLEKCMKWVEELNMLLEDTNTANVSQLVI
ncbi:MAG: hypothetical protein ACE3JP_12900 [Ectobacillus sp.]